MTVRYELRAATAADADVMAEIFAAGNSETLDTMKAIGLSDDQWRDLVALQLRAQMLDYARRYPAATYELIVLPDTPGQPVVGRIFAERRRDAIELIDLALLPAARGQGLGSAILTGFRDEADRRDVPLLLRVLRSNTAAIALYERLGFVADELRRHGHEGPYSAMRYN